ncbi:GNAT family N-acetyltransferase [Bradyrhizobium sp. NAS80.1]|uniref:GNAT family N-acetyltransferase n=1 Tax=Bradyrhizobium sp. NAS80.1 TaxID=1680159 RepID=UPI00143DE4A5|nr:GNAT family N-acetyltransferase [Bradyrhizobium sp. NAS80.1]
MMNIRIEHLTDYKSCIQTIATWQRDEFGYLTPEVTLEQRIARLANANDRERLPISLLALSEDGNTIVGTANVLATTLTHKHLSPWLSSVFVPPEHRRQGVASALALAAASEAERLGFSYLFTPHSEPLYSRLGWATFDRVLLHGTPLAIMARRTIGPVGNASLNDL